MAIVTCLSPVAWKRTKISNFQNNLQTSQSRLSAASILLRHYLVLSHPCCRFTRFCPSFLHHLCRIVTLVNVTAQPTTHTTSPRATNITTPPLPSFATLVCRLHWFTAYTTASFIPCILSQPCRLSYCLLVTFATRTSLFHTTFAAHCLSSIHSFATSLYYHQHA
jgi:hypothetical protein